MPGSTGTRREASVKNRSGSKNKYSQEGIEMQIEAITKV